MPPPPWDPVARDGFLSAGDDDEFAEDDDESDGGGGGHVGGKGDCVDVARPAAAVVGDEDEWSDP